jgi:hypothetical protein
MNVSWMPLYKMYVYWIIRNPRWMPPHENGLTLPKAEPFFWGIYRITFCDKFYIQV